MVPAFGFPHLTKKEWKCQRTDVFLKTVECRGLMVLGGGGNVVSVVCDFGMDKERACSQLINLLHWEVITWQ